MRDADVVPVVLSEDEHEKILTSRILPAWTRDAVPQDSPSPCWSADHPAAESPPHARY